MNVTALSDRDLVTRIQSLNGESHRLLATLLVHLGEMDKRKLYKRHALPSMFQYCRRRLRMSEGAAQRRILSARAVRRFPKLLPLVERGELHLTALSLVSRLLTEANVDSVIADVAGKTKLEVLEVVARLAPKKDAKEMIRAMPEPREPVVEALTSFSPGPPPAALDAPAVSVQSLLSLDAPQSRLPLLPTSVSPSPVAVAPTEVPVSPSSTALEASAPAPTSPPPAAAKVPAPPVVPLAVDRYKVQLTANKAMVEKSERVKDLMRHRNPTGDLATIFDRALDLLIESLEKERFGKTSRPQKVERPCQSGHVSAAKRRALADRDGEQCTYTDAEGNRCPEKGWLEVDHIDPAGMGGTEALENLRLRCRAHNQMHAEDTYGAEHIERRIEESRAKRKRDDDSEVRPHRGDEPACEVRIGRRLSPARVESEIDGDLTMRGVSRT